MQSVKIALRTVGVPSPVLGIESGESASESIKEEYLSQGYEIQNSFFVGAIKDQQGNELGYRLMFVLVRNEIPEPQVLIGDEGESAPVKRGRHAKVS